MHAALPHRVVLHVHCVNTIAWAVRSDAPIQLQRRLEGLRWQWIPYIASGLPLSREIEHALSACPDTNLFVLGNHGLVIGGEDAKTVEDLLTEVKRRLAIPPDRHTRPIMRRSWRSPGIHPWDLPDDDGVHALGTDVISQAILAGGLLYPCQAIFSDSRTPELFRPIPYPDPRRPLAKSILQSTIPDYRGTRSSSLARSMAPAELAMISGLAQVVQRLKRIRATALPYGSRGCRHLQPGGVSLPGTRECSWRLRGAPARRRSLTVGHSPRIMLYSARGFSTSRAPRIAQPISSAAPSGSMESRHGDAATGLCPPRIRKVNWKLAGQSSSCASLSILLLLSRQLFLVSELYFEQVFMQPDSADRYPRRSYPIDFLAGLQFWWGRRRRQRWVHLRIRGEFAPFTLLRRALFLSVIWSGWRLRRCAVFSPIALISQYAQFQYWNADCGGGRELREAAESDAVFADPGRWECWPRSACTQHFRARSGATNPSTRSDGAAAAVPPVSFNHCSSYSQYYNY